MEEELVRGRRQKTRDITKELEETQRHLREKSETNEALNKAVRKGVEKLDALRSDGLRWKRFEMEEQIRSGEGRSSYEEGKISGGSVRAAGVW